MVKYYRIAVKLITGQIFSYTVDNYEIEGPFIKFIDNKTDKPLYFDTSNVQIEEIEK